MDPKACSASIKAAMPPSFCACATAWGQRLFYQMILDHRRSDLLDNHQHPRQYQAPETRAHDFGFCSARSPKRLHGSFTKSFRSTSGHHCFSRSSPNFLEISSNFFCFFAILFSYFLLYECMQLTNFRPWRTHSYPFLELFFIWHKLHYTKFSPFNKRTS